MKFVDVPKNMKCITSHASAMHHFYKMMEWMDLEADSYKNMKHKYLDFKNQMASKGMDKLARELTKQIELKKVVSWNIEQLKGMIDEA